MGDDRLVIVEIITLGNNDLAGEDDDEAGSDLADDPKRFTGCKGAKLTEPTYPLDFHWIELGKHLIAPLFANRLHLQRHLASAGT